ncbi:IS4 family transposase [Capsulimonas corticalis]|uniref:IS4 family transposase n=1 Tax=Capsulimonas corticalis TaxID=2219043 RepID=A0A9N7L991_9BACT|nr:IS4 family transposase [Capsulimonas corticalis]BDI33712.1 IS4 family transposase [Capsulimonas corticalis]
MLGSGWAENEIQGTKFGDERFRRVMGETLEAKFSQPNVSFSTMCGNALRQSAGRLLRHPETNATDLLEGHRQATLQRCLGEKTIVVAQDTSSYNYSTHYATEGLGPINDSKKAMGIHQHSALAMTPDRLPLGVVEAHFWARPLEKQAAAQRRKKPIEEKESHRWLRTAKHVEQLFEPHLRQGGEVVVVADREADIFDLLAQERASGLELIIRAAHPRTVKVMDGEVMDGEVMDRSEGATKEPAYCSLLVAAQQGNVLGHYTLRVPGRTQAQDRDATMEMRHCRVEVQPPKAGVGHEEKAVPIQVVSAREIVPEGDPHAPLEWIMITTVNVIDMASARRVLDLYTCRWEIERFHFTLKSGCQAERLQMDDLDTLCNTLSLYLVVAWRLLYVTHLARVMPEIRADQIMDTTELAILNQQSRTPITTISQVVTAIAQLGGFEPYKGGPLPGVKVLWNGLRKLDSMAAGWRLAMESIRTQNVIQA